MFRRIISTLSKITTRSFAIQIKPPGDLPKPSKAAYTIDLNHIKGAKYSKSGLYVMMFTCKICEQKHARTFSKDAYHQGVVIIRCEKCKNLHLIADNLGWFADKSINIEDIMKKEGQEVTKLMTDDCFQFLKDQENDAVK